MATALEPTPLGEESLAVATWAEPGERDSKADRYLASRLAAASADFKGVALTTFFLGATVAALVWLAFGVALEHWIVPGGLPTWARWAWLGTALVAGLAASIRWLLPLAVYRVNLVYAARAIEQDHPEFHNDLVNAVLVKARPGGVHSRVVRSLERRAATGLTSVPTEGVIDRTPALRFAIGLALLVALACLYEIAAPKSLLATAARLVAPWTNLAAPSRVRVEPPRLRWRTPGEQPADGAAATGKGANDAARTLPVIDGTVTLVRGRQLVISTMIRGLASSEKPAIVVTPLTDDGQVDHAVPPWRTPLATIDAEGRHVAELLDATRGLDRSVELVIIAGDARTAPLRIAVVDAPTLLVREVRYDYPDYTQLEDETVAWQGDLKGVEGTRVTLVAESNRPLEAAWIDLGCDGKSELRLRTSTQDLARATGSFMLRLNRDRSGAEHAMYRLMFQPQAATAAQREEAIVENVEHRIEVLPDLAPEVAIVDPQEQVVTVPPSAPVGIRIRAIDPDFGLTRVGIETRLKGTDAAQETVLFRGLKRDAVSTVATIVPQKAGAKAGSVLEYRAFAFDNRPEQANSTFTEWRTLKIDDQAPPRPEPKQPPAGGRQGDANASGSDQPPSGTDQPATGDRDTGKEPSTAQDAGGSEKGKPGAEGADSATQPDAGAGGSDPKPRSESGRDQPTKPQQPGNAAGQTAPATNPAASQAGKAPGGGDTQPKDPRSGEPQPGSQSGSADGQQQKNGDQGQAGKQSGPQKADGEPQSGAGDSGGAGSQGSGSQAGGGEPRGNTGAGSGQQQGTQSGKTGETSGKASGNQPGQGSGSQPGQGSGSQPGQGSGSQPGQGSGKQPGQGAGSQPGQGSESQPGQGSGKQPGQGSGSEQGQGSQGQSDQGGGRQPGQNQSNQSGQNAGSQSGQGSQNQSGKTPGSGQGQGNEPSPSSSGGAPKSDGGGKPSSPKQPSVAADGTDDGTAMERILDHKRSESGGDCKDGSCQGGSGGSGQSGSGKQGSQGSGQPGQGSGSQPGQGSGSQPGQGSGSQPGQGAGSQPGQGSGSQPGQGSGSQPGQGSGSQPGQGSGSQPGQGSGSQPGQGSGSQPGQGSGSQPGQGSGSQPGAEQSAQPGAGEPGSGDSSSGENGAGQLGGAPGQAADGQPAQERGKRDVERGDQDLANARNAADLAIKHLRDDLDAGRTDVLDQLGWTPEQARQFLDRWEAMRRQANSGDPRKKIEFDRAVRSLGLRPDGVRSSRAVPTDARGGQTEGRRSRPPSEYRDQLKAYLQSTDGQ